MDPLISYSLPVSGLRDGLHLFDFQIDDQFFAAFESSAITSGDIDVHLRFDKQPSLFVLDFRIEGTIKQECDRCLALFDLPISAENSLKVKFDDNERDEEEVVYVSRERRQLNVARFIYEFVHLAIPMVKTHDIAEEECDPAFLDYLTKEEKEPENESKEKSSVWDALKKLKDQ